MNYGAIGAIIGHELASLTSVCRLTDPSLSLLTADILWITLGAIGVVVFFVFLIQRLRDCNL